MFPYKDENPTVLAPIITVGIIVVNVLAWLLVQGAGAAEPLARLGSSFERSEIFLSIDSSPPHQIRRRPEPQPSSKGWGRSATRPASPSRTKKRGGISPPSFPQTVSPNQ